jgi:hypothetical protein
MNKLVLVEPAELAELVRDAVVEALSAQPKAASTPPALLDRKRLAEALDLSVAALDRVRAEPSFPELRIGDAPRFELDRVLEWLRAQSDGPALRVVGGAR